MVNIALQINFQDAKRKADRLAQIGREIKEMADRDYEETINAINSAWTGENASAYLAKARSLQQKMSATGQSLIDIADEITRKAKVIYDAEMDAWNIANQRKYGNGAMPKSGGGS